MTLKIKIGRRVHKSWAKRTAQKLAGLISFQENIWIMIVQSINLAKQKANESGKIKFVVTKSMEFEDLHYNLEWLEITIQGTKEAEDDEEKDMANFYAPFSKLFTKNLDDNILMSDNVLKKHFKTKMLNIDSLEEAYKKGYGAVSNNNLANKMLEMGILTHVERINDYATRPPC